jgi:hypothetical protein
MGLCKALLESVQTSLSRLLLNEEHSSTEDVKFDRVQYIMALEAVREYLVFIYECTSH